MSDNRKYPTRMHEALGVEPFDEFSIPARGNKRVFCLNYGGRLLEKDEDGHWRNRGSIIEDGIIYGIIRKPALTEEQIDILMALWTLGYRHVAKDSDGFIHAYFGCHRKDKWAWLSATCFRVHRPAISNLVSWDDQEPLDIVQTLRDNGVEVAN